MALEETAREKQEREIREKMDADLAKADEEFERSVALKEWTERGLSEADFDAAWAKIRQDVTTRKATEAMAAARQQLARHYAREFGR